MSDVPPQDDIGPFYKTIGAICLFAGIGLAFYHEYHDRVFGWVDACIVGVLVIASIALIRPDKFDAVVKTIADRLPFFSYTKNDADGDR